MDITKASIPRFLNHYNRGLRLGISTINRFYSLNEADEPDENFIVSSGLCTWATNLEPDWEEQEKIFVPPSFPRYDDVDAIECSEVKNLQYVPEDYSGIIGVPITFWTKYWKIKEYQQFKVVDILSPTLNGKKLFKRLLIKRI